MATTRQLREPFGAGEPGQRDQLGDEVAQPVRLADDLGAEPADLGGVVGGVEHGLGEQPDRADRRLELVADVGHEVAPGGLQAHRVGRVGRLDHRVAVAERAHAARARRRVGGRAGPAATGRRRPRCRGSRTSAHAAAARGVGLVVGDDAQLAGARVGEHGHAAPVDDDETLVGGGEDALQEIAQRAARRRGARRRDHPPTAAPPAADRDAHRERERRDQHTDHTGHGAIVGSPPRGNARRDGRDAADRQCSALVHAPFTRACGKREAAHGRQRPCAATAAMASFAASGSR